MADIARISPAEAHAKLSEGYVYVDVRSEQEFDAGHPAGAYNVPLMHMGAGGMVQNPDFLRVMNAAFGKDAKVVVGCKSGARSLRAAQALVADGFEQIIDQRAGWDGTRDAFGQVKEPGWSRAGLPTAEAAAAGHAYADLQAKA